ncbi:hypothetical protein HII13_001553 [Brettanomyces bruxellensis]|nr:hypothetical protein HII13_001553 [Brettanomyces bruxellensis]
MNQGWLTVILTSATTICGCLIIYADVVYKYVFPARYRKKPFEIAKNTQFLVCSLALSSGCLSFVSLYKLLPTSMKYLHKVPTLDDQKTVLQSTAFIFYVSGIMCCSALNVLVHLFTSEIITMFTITIMATGISCIDITRATPRRIWRMTRAWMRPRRLRKENTEVSDTVQKKNCKHSSRAPYPVRSPRQIATYSSKIQTAVSGSSPSISSSLCNAPTGSSLTPSASRRRISAIAEDSAPTQTHAAAATSISGSVTSSAEPSVVSSVVSGASGIPPKQSVVDASLDALRGQKMEGDCFGDMECCCEEIACKHNLHMHKNKNGIRFCCYPSSENQLFFKQRSGEMVTDKSELAGRFPELEIQSPLLPDSGTGAEVRTPPGGAEAGNSSSSSPNLETNLATEHSPLLAEQQTSADADAKHYSGTDSSVKVPINVSAIKEEPEDVAAEHIRHHEHHHHHIKTPLARLLSIGIQTTLAITMHKLPEGFIMYSTSQADSKLGWTIFLSMFVHNFVEGFTMTLPIYVALNSRWKALLISGTLGGCAQPFGALIGYFIFRKNGVDVDNPFSMALIGSLMALTSGFLTYIGLQMLTSSISFGGKQETVMKWALFGICLIFLTNIVL